MTDGPGCSLTHIRIVGQLIILLVAVVPAVSCHRTGFDVPSERGARRTGTVPSSRVVLGSDELFAGIPGEGPLTIEQIKKWLADPANHEPLDWRLHPALPSSTPAVSVPDDNPLTRAKIELGRQLFLDVRLSDNERMSCADCHHPLRAFSSDLIGHERLREPPVAFNRLFGQKQFWDGRATSLEEQPRFAIENPDELDSTLEAAVARIEAIEGYRLQFKRIFGQVDIEGISQALASFQRATVAKPSPWDYHQTRERLHQADPVSLTDNDRKLLQEANTAVEQRSLSESAMRGAQLFFSERVGCSRCHSGANFSDEAFHNVGSEVLPTVSSAAKAAGPLIRPRREQDTGRMQVTGDPADRGAFKTPTLRNLARTPPYLHDGRFLSLESAVDFFLRGGYGEHSELQAVELTADQRRDLLEFLRSLDSPLPKIELSRLPQ